MTVRCPCSHPLPPTSLREHVAFDSEVNWRITSFMELWRIQYLGVEGLRSAASLSSVNISRWGTVGCWGSGVGVRGECGHDRSIADVRWGHKSLALNHRLQTVYRRCWSLGCVSCRGFLLSSVIQQTHLFPLLLATPPPTHNPPSLFHGEEKSL